MQKVENEVSGLKKTSFLANFAKNGENRAFLGTVTSIFNFLQFITITIKVRVNDFSFPGLQ